MQTIVHLSIVHLSSTIATDLAPLAAMLFDSSIGDLASKIKNVSSEITKIVVPLGVLGVVLWGIAQVAAPVLPEWAQTMKGYFQRACVALVVVSLSTAIIEGIASIK